MSDDELSGSINVSFQAWGTDAAGSPPKARISRMETVASRTHPSFDLSIDEARWLSRKLQAFLDKYDTR